MSDASNAPRDITEDPDHAIVMSDGTRLSARLWRPADDSEQVPAILEFLPYRKRWTTPSR